MKKQKFSMTGIAVRTVLFLTPLILSMPVQGQAAQIARVQTGMPITAPSRAAVPAVRPSGADLPGGCLPEADPAAVRLPKIRLPEVDLSDIDRNAEKEKLREALQALDDLGISPEKLVKRAWELVSRRKLQDKIRTAAEKVTKTVSKEEREKVTKTVSKEDRGEVPEEESKEDPEEAAKEIREKLSKEVGEEVSGEVKKQIDQAADSLTEELKKKAKEKLSEVIDHAHF